MSSAVYEEWDPFVNADGKRETPSPQCVFRLKRDLMAIYNEPPYGILVVPDDTDITVIHALITGAFDTPYEGGFFYFILRCPSDYPLRPPRVKLMTTGAGQVRFNPNLYKCGKVCLSILGTWSGPCWSPAQSLCSVLISIQSVLNEKPYHNEPGFEVEKLPGDVERYNEIIQHETLRVAVCGMLENDYGLNIPKALVEIMQKTFLQYYEYYENVALKKMALTGMPMQDPFSERRGRFQYKFILARLQNLRSKLTKNKMIAEPVSDTGQVSDTSSPGSDMDPDDDSINATNSNTVSTKAASETLSTGENQGNLELNCSGGGNSGHVQPGGG